ncbi:MAG TPA: hypothetical protein VFE46_00355 [Pirellulales bacterium]|jgi:hypothetical protein|nr:hypothetical protein [Pirellulales bacterium]
MNRTLHWRFLHSALPVLGIAVLLCISGTVTCSSTVHAETATPPSSTASAAELTPRDLHVWGRFDPGTWKQVRVITDALNSRGEVVDTTTTEIKTTLLRADAKRLTLRIEAIVEVGGRRFESPAQIVEYGYYGESPNQPAELKSLGSEPLTVDGRQVSCRIQQLVANTGHDKEITQFFLSDDVEPYVLKRETRIFTADGKSPQDPQTTVEVIALDMPYKVLHEMKSTAYERTIQRSDHGANVTLDVTSVDVPGGIVARTSKEFDSEGRLVRRSTLELVDYRVVDNDDDNADNSSGDKNNPQNLTRRQVKRARKHS